MLKNPLNCEDTKTALRICKNLGAKAQVKNNSILISSPGMLLAPRVEKLFTGDSGITTRFILPVLGLRANYHKAIILDCGEQMKSRPIKPLIDALNNLGMNIASIKNNNHCPLKIRGELMGGKIEVDGTTSQYISALLIALPCAKRDSEIVVKNLNERPYVEMTKKWLIGQKIIFRHLRKNQADIFKIKGRQKYCKFSKEIPGDFSSVSYLIAAGAMLGKKVEILGLDFKDEQGDKELVGILKKMGAKIYLKKSRLIITKSSLKGIKINANSIPDLVPTLAVLGSAAEGKTEIVNVPQARLKETDRLKSMATELRKMGVQIYENKDGLKVYCSKLFGAKVQGHNDHRTVMALALAGIVAQGKTEISTAEAINKTFPEFTLIMKSLGAKIKLIK
jgi:3-phosphoshikimate 1-carboxyvinyltransferase